MGTDLSWHKWNSCTRSLQALGKLEMKRRLSYSDNYPYAGHWLLLRPLYFFPRDFLRSDQSDVIDGTMFDKSREVVTPHTDLAV